MLSSSGAASAADRPLLGFWVVVVGTCALVTAFWLPDGIELELTDADLLPVEGLGVDEGATGVDDEGVDVDDGDEVVEVEEAMLRLLKGTGVREINVWGRPSKLFRALSIGVKLPRDGAVDRLVVVAAPVTWTMVVGLSIDEAEEEDDLRFGEDGSDL